MIKFKTVGFPADYDVLLEFQAVCDSGSGKCWKGPFPKATPKNRCVRGVCNFDDRGMKALPDATALGSVFYGYSVTIFNDQDEPVDYEDPGVMIIP